MNGEPPDLKYRRHIRLEPARIDRLPPHSVEAEQGVLGSVLMAPYESVGMCIERLSECADTFYDIRHQTIFKAIVEMFDSREAIDLITLQQRLKDSNRLDEVGGIAYLSELPNAVPSAANLPYWLDIIEEKYLLRRIILTCTDAVASVYDHESDPMELLDTVERDILAIRPHKNQQSPDIKKLVKDAITSIEELWNLKGACRGIPTGFTDLDKMTSGMISGEVTIIAGYPGSGKTSFAMNLAEHAMLGSSRRVGVFSLEMSSVALVTRFICSHARVNLSHVKSGFIAERDFPKLTGAAHDINLAEIRFEDDSDLTIYQLRAKARRLKQQHGIELILIDYLQLLTATGGGRKIESRQQEVADISRGIKAIARELHIPVIALSQLNDDGKLRESRSIGQDADNVWILEAKKLGEGEDDCTVQPTTLKIVKARNGPVGKVELMFLKQYTRFESVSKVADEDVPPSSREPYND
jgi:replicative DNA helicase